MSEQSKEIEIASLLNLEKCTFDDECDLCESPELGTFSRDMSVYEYDDDFYWVCGKCLNEVNDKYPNLDNIQLLQKIDAEVENNGKLPF